MSKGTRPRYRLRNRGELRSDSGTYSVGYGKPPRKHRFQPGHSGNPKGRPKGKKNTATLVREILDRKIEVRSGGTTRTVTVREGILTGFAQASLKGDTKSAAFLLQLYEKTQEAQEGHLTGEEQEIIETYAKAYLEKHGKDQ
jgi:hypothetical protein